ncbi:hypothetical protein CTI12_AA064360 [Artemisia annua]|uniref:Uncharacterized protein n=1 Tax=Artemisia annua TaxID=35608 RepID=A0A2U1PTG4_ARTAN|nr:hypothetical protein CTI12_AA064360 [Artemisia annua]
MEFVKPVITPKDVIPWVGLYVAGASLACTLAMAADAFQGFLDWKLWFPNKFFAINTVSITLIAIAMKLPVDLTTNVSKDCGDWDAKMVSIAFLVTMIANFLPSLGLMDDKELLVNMVAWSILLITITVNVAIQIIAGRLPAIFFWLLLFPILRVFSIAFTVPASRRILEHRYKELHGLASYPKEIKFSYEELKHNVKKYWMMAETVNVSNSNVRSEMKEYATYVLQIEDDAKLSERISRNALKSINQLLSKSEKKEPRNLIKLLKKSTGFQGVLEFTNDQVPPLHSEETKNSWSLVVMTLTAIFVALPNTAGDHGEGLIASMREGLRIVRTIEECLNIDSDLVKTRKAARRVWTEVEVYRKWLQIDLQKKAHDGKTTKEILEWLRDEAVKIVIQFKSCKTRRIDDSRYKFIAASSMYRVSQSILIHCNELENWPTDGKVLEWISNMIADILCACFTNLPRVIKMMCHHDAIEKREDSVRSAAQLLGRSRNVLKILNIRQLPNMDVDSMAYISKWHALPKSDIPNGAPLNQIQLAFPTPNESVIVNIGV